MERYLVVIDMQKDFIDGALGSEMAQRIVPEVIRKIGEYKPGNIYATRDTHFENYLDTLEGKKLPVTHCIKESEGWQIHPEVSAAMPEAKIFDKYTFGSEQLAQELYQRSLAGEMEIELAGLCTDICVVSNALLLRAKLPGTVIRVDPKCCAGVTEETHKAALQTMKMCQIDILTEEETDVAGEKRSAEKKPASGRS
ncbi:MAG: cysteine hydrolase [Lachnospiraceae bacterium]|nr:cysteine hydrolase [Lachnospiraceae bacterium]